MFNHFTAGGTAASRQQTQTQIAKPITVADIIEEYEAKKAAMDGAVAAFDQAFHDINTAATVLGTFVETVVQKPYIYPETLRLNLLKSAWQAVYNRLQIDALASANDKKLFERTLAKPPELTMETAVATFSDYLVRPRFHALRGLAEVFTTLDPAYKSHSKVKIGVKGLPKRVIINAWGEFSHTYGKDKFRDLVKALAAVRGQAPFEWSEMQAVELAHKQGEDAVLDGRAYYEPDRYHPNDETRMKVFKTVDRGITVRRFANGNAHVIFDPEALKAINQALAEFYGEVLPDAEPEDVTPSASTAVSKDLQFYWSPPAVVKAVLDFADIYDPESYCGQPPRYKVLEPSCGNGLILDELRRRGCDSLGIEYHPGRAAEARAKGHSVVTANFLEEPATGDFDFVVMNPPFYGRHWLKHVQHAAGFLRPGGTLVAILPASARYDEEKINGEWRDLPVASFAEAGTNVPTTMLKIKVVI